MKKILAVYILLLLNSCTILFPMLGNKMDRAMDLTTAIDRGNWYYIKPDNSREILFFYDSLDIKNNIVFGKTANQIDTSFRLDSVIFVAKKPFPAMQSLGIFFGVLLDLIILFNLTIANAIMIGGK